MRLDLEHVAIPDETGAEERAWRVVQCRVCRARALHAACRSAARLLVGDRNGLRDWRRSSRSAVSPAGSALLHSIRQEIGLTHAAPALTRLPAPGALLVTSNAGPWLVQPDGSKRLLGRYARGVAVAARALRRGDAAPRAAGRRPEGHVRWSLARAGTIRLPRWAPDGYRIAYLDGSSLRIVAGDGTGDHGFADAVAQVAPAWRPSIVDEHVLAFSSARGELELYAVDGNVLYARHRLAAVPLQLLWSSDGARLVALSTHEISVFDHNGRPLGTIHVAPTRGRGCLRRRTATGSPSILSGARSDAVTFDLDRPSRKPREVFSGSGRFSALDLVAERPLAADRLADREPVAVRLAHDGRATAVADIAAQFDGEPGTSTRRLVLLGPTSPRRRPRHRSPPAAARARG